ncbi:MAG: transposase [Gammaproteobacteria bacterium]
MTCTTCSRRRRNRQPVFFTEADCRVYHECLTGAVDRHGCAVHAYVFMTNHVHLLLTPNAEGAPSLLTQFVGRRFVRHINASCQRTWTLWEGRYKSVIIDAATGTHQPSDRNVI